MHHISSAWRSKLLRTWIIALAVLFSPIAAISQTGPIPLPPPSLKPPVSDEPARWTQEDATPEQKFATARKEALAANQMALDECKTMIGDDKAKCEAQARLDLVLDMARIREKFGIKQP
jgi:predicted small lipoprotein YifL